MTRNRALATGKRVWDLEDDRRGERSPFAGLWIAAMVAALFAAGLHLVQVPGMVTAEGDVQITTDPKGDINPDWSVDGETLLFGRRLDTQCCSGMLWLTNADGSNQRPLSSNEVEETGDFSPDGSKIVFVTWPSSRGDYADVRVMNADGTGAVETSPGGTLNFGAPRWSHDGGRIVGHAIVGSSGSTHVGTHRLWIMDADGSDFRVILDRGYFPMFLPGDTEIVFTDFNLEETEFHLAILSLASGNVTQLTTGPADLEPDVSSDGDILFTRCATYPAPTACDLYATDRNGVAFERLTFDGAGNSGGRFSPDGGKIAYVSERSGNRDIWVHSIPAPPMVHFGLTVSPASRTVVAGETTDYYVQLAEQGDFTAPVGLTVTGAPEGVTVSFAGNSLSPVASTIMTVVVDATTAPGTYTLTVRGVGGQEEHSDPSELVVRPAPAVPVAPTADLPWAMIALAVLPFLLAAVFLARRRRKDGEEQISPQPEEPKVDKPAQQGLSAKERLTLLEGRLARGEVSEPLYRELRQKYESEEQGGK